MELVDEAEPGDAVQMLQSRRPWLKLVQEDSADKYQFEKRSSERS
jgi:hypothetical protein